MPEIWASILLHRYLLLHLSLLFLRNWIYVYGIFQNSNSLYFYNNNSNTKIFIIIFAADEVVVYRIGNGMLKKMPPPVSNSTSPRTYETHV